MQNKKDKKLIGQQPLLNEFDEKNEQEDRPRGMPTLAQMQQEMKLRGLTPKDAEHLYNVWLMNGYKTGRGTQIKNWKAAIRIWQMNDWLPSQRNVKQNTAKQDAAAQTFSRMKRNGNHSAR